tara:strand:- start:1428 stop:3770 length:2343 start_codon:yes stop_codon:yes gene_type:complete
MLIPLIHTVQADGAGSQDLEAKNLTASFDSNNETVTLTWSNFDTNDFTILQDLKTTNYSLYRSDEPLNSSNYQQAELVEDSIQACLSADSLPDCKAREHVVVYNTPPNTDGSYYYGVISTLEDGSIIDNLSLGNASLSEPVNELGSPITSPYGLQAIYDIENGTTYLSWIDVSQVDASIGSIHTTSIWSHSTQANISNWMSLNKTQIVANLSSSVNSYEIVHLSDVSRVNFYTVLHSFDGELDARLLSGNTLIEGLSEDNVGPVIDGTLLAHFNATTDKTALNWNGSVIEDVNHTLHIWRSISAISDIHADGVEEIVQLSANSTHYNFTVESGYSGESYYLITLSDEFGNHQTNLALAPNAHVYEYTLTTNQNIVTDLSASHSLGVTQLTWTDLADHSEATYQIWRSTTGQINSSTFNTSNVTLLATVEAGVEHYNNTFADGVSEYSWYAVTAIASFGTGNTTYSQTNLSLTLNSLSAYVGEDTKKPTAPVVLNANYLVNGTTQISWMGGAQEQDTMWTVYRNLYTELDEEAFWVQVAQMENDGISLHTIFVNTLAQTGEVVTPVYAIGATDAFGNAIEFEDWRLSSSVNEDRQSPYLQLQLYDSQMQLETSRWFNGGESATFSNLAVDNYTIKFAVSDDAASIDYTMSTDSESKNLNLAVGLAQITMAVSEEMANISISFTVTDFTGNTASFNTLFCTSCLIQENTEIQVDDEEKEVAEDKEEVNDPNVRILIGVCIILLLIIISLMFRGPKPSITKPEKALSGLPLKSEDQWISKYIN